MVGVPVSEDAVDTDTWHLGGFQVRDGSVHVWKTQGKTACCSQCKYSKERRVGVTRDVVKLVHQRLCY